MTAARKLTAEQRAACVCSRPKLRLVRVTPVEPERPAASERVENVVLVLVGIAAPLVFAARVAGWT